MLFFRQIVAPCSNSNAAPLVCLLFCFAAVWKLDAVAVLIKTMPDRECAADATAKESLAQTRKIPYNKAVYIVCK